MKLGMKKQILIWSLASIPLLMTLAVYSQLPDEIPLHWNIAGEVNRTGPKFPGAFLLPALSLVIPLLMTVVPKIDPHKENYEKFGGAYYWIRFMLVVFFAALNTAVLFTALGASVRVDLLVKLLVGVLILVIGNLMPKLKHNYFVGIKTPWTFNSEEVWYKTHRHGGRIWFAAGIIMCILAFIPGNASAYAYFGVIMAASAEPVIYSYLQHRKRMKTV